MRSLLIAIACAASLPVGFAGTFDFSYVFDSGKFIDKETGAFGQGPVEVHGSFNGTRNGNAIDNPTDISMYVNGNRAEGFWAIDWNGPHVGNLQPNGPVSINFDALLNNFIFYEITDDPRNHTYFYILNDPQGAVAHPQARTLFDKYGIGVEAFEVPVNPAHWTITEREPRSVPEDGSTALMFAAAAIVLSAARLKVRN